MELQMTKAILIFFIVRRYEIGFDILSAPTSYIKQREDYFSRWIFYKMERLFMNKSSAIEWLRKPYHDLKSAQILYDANHYTDSIGVNLHCAVEKSLKAFLAYDNSKIPKTHNLPELYEYDAKIAYISNRI